MNSESCGYYQIKQNYWIDCKRPGSCKLYNRIFILKIFDSIYIKVRFVFVNLFSSPVVYYLNKYTYLSVKIKRFISLDEYKSNAALSSIFKTLSFVLIPCLQITNFKLYSVLCKQILKLIKAHSITLFSFKEFHYLTYCHN